MTVNELDKIVALTLEDRQMVYGSHLSGGGFGGCIVTLLHKDAVEDAKLRIMVRAVSLELSLSLFSLYPSLSLLPSPFISFCPLLFSLVHTHIVCCCHCVLIFSKNTGPVTTRRRLLWCVTPVVVPG